VGILGVLVLVEEKRTVEDNAGKGVGAGVQEGSEASVGSDMLDVLTRDPPAHKRLISRLYASSRLKVDVTVGRVIVVDTVGVGDGVGGGVVSVEFKMGSGMFEFDRSVETIPPVPPAPLMIERALDPEVHPTN
jgi:hypothetical protein